MPPEASPKHAPQHVPSSVALEQLIRDAPPGRVTMAWMMDRLGARSFGVILLLLGICSLLPGLSQAIGVLLAIPASQMLRAQAAPHFPRRVADRSIPTDKLAAATRRLIPTIRYLERFVRPRWRAPDKATKRVVGGVVLLLGIGLLAPFPLSNVPIALVLVLVAFAYLEEDGALLLVALIVALGLVGAAIILVWDAVSAAQGWLS